MSGVGLLMQIVTGASLVPVHSMYGARTKCLQPSLVLWQLSMQSCALAA